MKNFLHQTSKAWCCCRLLLILVSKDVLTISLIYLLSVHRNNVPLKTGVERSITEGRRGKLVKIKRQFAYMYLITLKNGGKKLKIMKKSLIISLAQGMLLCAEVNILLSFTSQLQVFDNNFKSLKKFNQTSHVSENMNASKKLTCSPWSYRNIPNPLSQCPPVQFLSWMVKGDNKKK